jgi:hypothetical protein
MDGVLLIDCNIYVSEMLEQTFIPFFVFFRFLDLALLETQISLCGPKLTGELKIPTGKRKKQFLRKTTRDRAIGKQKIVCRFHISPSVAHPKENAFRQLP